MLDLPFPALTDEKVLKDSAQHHFLRPAVSLQARLCHAYLTDRRLVLCEAHYDAARKAEKGVGEVLHEVPLLSIENVRQCPDGVEPYIEVDARGADGGLDTLFVYFRDKGWHAGAPLRLEEADAWLEAINAERQRLGFFPQPLAPRGASRSPATPARPATRPAEAAAAPAAANPIGARLGGQYEILREIGLGGMGVVYEGKDHSLERPVAIKKMRSEIRMAGREKALFLQEARTAASLHHPFVVDIYAILEEGGEIYLVFEYVDGKSLHEYLDEHGHMPLEKLRPVLKCVCDALAYAHSKKVAHRDLKPSNIMLTSQGYAKVMDFGIARQIKDTVSRLTNKDVSGTLPYMAPEQERGKFDARSDIFALGVTVYELLSGQLPFIGPNFYLQKERGDFLRLADAAPGLPAEAAAAVEKCLCFDPTGRFQNVEDFAKAAGAA